MRIPVFEVNESSKLNMDFLLEHCRCAELNYAPAQQSLIRSIDFASGDLIGFQDIIFIN